MPEFTEAQEAYYQEQLAALKAANSYTIRSNAYNIASSMLELFIAEEDDEPVPQHQLDDEETPRHEWENKEY